MAARYAPVPAPTNDVIRVAESAFPGVRIADPFAAGNRQDDRSETSDDEEQSDEDEQSEKARLTFEEGAADNDDQGWTTAKALSRRRRLLLLPPTLLLFLLLGMLVASELFSSSRHRFHGEGLKRIELEHLANGTFQVERRSLDWLAEAGDGVYSERIDGSIILRDVRSNTTKVLVAGTAIRDEHGEQLWWSSFSVSADLEYILFGADEQSQWRHSSHSNFYVHSLATGRTTPLRKPVSPPHTAIARFSPVAHHVLYVHANDLYVLEAPRDGEKHDDNEPIRVTDNGGPTTFNGVPDWVYEEEVYEGDSTSFWNPTGTRIAFISADESLVPEYEFPIYSPLSRPAPFEPYPSSVIMRYPTAGKPNPIVALSVFDLQRYLDLPKRPTKGPVTTDGKVDPHVAAFTYRLVLSNPFPDDDMVITEVAWISADELMVKVTDRIARRLRVARFALGGAGFVKRANGDVVGEVVRELDYSQAGWVEPGQTIVGIESTALLQMVALEDLPTGYLEVLPDVKGFKHIAYFSPANASSPVFLTSGEWEVDGKIESVDLTRRLVYFTAANPSIERHLYSVPLPSVEGLASMQAGSAPLVALHVLTDDSVPGLFSFSFSPRARYYVLNYNGPGIPWQRVVDVSDKSETILTDNAVLAVADAAFRKPDTTYTTVVASTGVELNVRELRPPLMDLSGRTKYPILFQVYGGPASQLVNVGYTRDYHHYLCTSLNYIVVTVDPRGTGFKGRDFRTPVRERLGELEALDVVNAARVYAALPYVDEDRVGVWGWSYGGFLTAKIVETNSSVFTLGMSVAPVVDWRFYDSIYTERYMATPETNSVGYRNSSIRNMEGFKHVDFALAHGSGDDNVHFLNAAALLDQLTVAHVRGFRFRMFTDSDHGIRMRGAYWELMHWLTDFMLEKWGEGGRGKGRRSSSDDYVLAHETT